MQKPSKSRSKNYQDFRFRLRHDILLRQRLRRAKQEATINIARELGFDLSLEDLQKKPKNRSKVQRRQQNS